MNKHATLKAPGPWKHHSIHARGIGFHAAIAGDEPGRHTVILLHDFPLNWWSWRNQIIALEEAGYRVIALDLRGMGASDLQPGSTELEEIAKDVVAVAQATGTPSYTIIGSGIGGTVAWTVAHMNPPELVSTVVINADHPGRRRARKGARAVSEAQFTARRLMDGTLVDTLLVEGAAPSSIPQMEALVSAYAGPLRRVFAANAALETRRATRHPSAAAKRILETPVSTPIWSIRGGEDGFVKERETPRETSRDSELAGQEVTEIQIAHCGHYPNEEAPAELNRILLDHLQAVESPDTN